jgi:probable HAF family extracellular repeat protein
MGVNHGFLYSNGVYTTIDHPNVGTQETDSLLGTHLAGINDNGQIVGNYRANYTNGIGSHGAFYYENGTFTAIADPGSDWVTAYSLNNNGQVVGTTSTYNNTIQHQWYSGFIYDHGAFMRLDHPDAGGYGTFAAGINDLGQVVGYYEDSSYVAHSFLYSNGVYTDLPLPNYVDNSDSSFPQTLSNYAFDINNDGVILGAVQTSAYGGGGYAVMLTPVPEPSLYTMMASGLGLLILVTHMRKRNTYKVISA